MESNIYFQIVFPILLGYFFGCIQTSYFGGKYKFSVNVKQEGSKNAGASNSVMLFGFKYGFFVGLVDVFKAYVPMMIIFSIYFEYPQDQVLVLACVAGAGAIIGHMFPFFMKFDGGKGMACYLGMLIGFDFSFGLIVCLIGAVLLMITNYVAAATIIIVVCIPIFAHFFCGATLSLVIAVALLSCLIITKHTENIFKILNGTESTFWSVFKK